MSNNILEFHILKPEQLRMFAMLVAELQARSVNFSIIQDYDRVLVTIK